MKQMAYLSVAALMAVALVDTSCASDKATSSTTDTYPATPGAGASSIAGSSAAGAGGDASAMGGATAASGGTSAAGGASAAAGALGCQISTPPTAALIADFSAGTAATTGLPAIPNGGMYTYGGTAAPTVAIANGALHVTINAAPTTAIQYVGYGIFFNLCTDGGNYTGVKFDIGGTMSGCGLQFIVNFKEDATPVNDPVKGGCPLPNCYGPQAEMIIPATVSESQYSFVTLSNGFPYPTVMTTFLTGIGWGFVIPAADPAATGTAGAAGTTNNCVADLTIDNVTFY